MKRKFSRTIKLLILFCLFIPLPLLAEQNSEPRVYKIWDNQPAPNKGADYSISKAGGYPFDGDWEKHSYPIGNGYLGANIFGRTDRERIQITEKTLANEGLYGLGGLTNFAEIYLEFNHKNVKAFKRELNINEAALRVSYENENINFKREYFASYPDNIIAIKLSANKKKKISFKLKAVIPYLRSAKEKNHRTGTTFAENNTITLQGRIPHFGINYEGQVHVIHTGGKIIHRNDNEEASIEICEADETIILIAAGTNYKLNPHLFTEKINGNKLDTKITPHKIVTDRIQNAASLGYDQLWQNHLNDYTAIFGKSELIFSEKLKETPTKKLLEDYKNGVNQSYLEELMFHYSRYLLIASSRKGALPCGLQGAWSQYAVSPWTGGYWHNINVQMNYWGAFNANLAETFTPYLEYFLAYLEKGKSLAREYILKNNPDKFSDDDDFGWTIGTGATAYMISPPGGHSGPGTAGFTSKLFWDYFEFTQDTSYLKEIGYPALLGVAKFLSKTLKEDSDGKLLVDPSSSPEQMHNKKFYGSVGTTFDQAFVWETYNDLIKASKVLNIRNPFLATVEAEIDLLDPILIGSSGQVKEFREEDQYGDIGDPHHRHTSQLCGLYPGTLINDKTSNWLNASSKTLDLRRNEPFQNEEGAIYGAYTGWALAHRMNLRARCKQGNIAYELYAKFLKEFSTPNLWTVHPPFQIDGNLGTMAGVVEMLIQSHQGFIEILPALPDKWKNGQFVGLKARGNFELAVSWKNGKANEIKLTARSGGTCNIRYENIEKATIKSNTEKEIQPSSKSKDQISLQTSKNQVYLIQMN